MTADRPDADVIVVDSAEGLTRSSSVAAAAS